MERERLFRPGIILEYWVLNDRKYWNVSANEAFLVLIPFDFVEGGIVYYPDKRLKFSLSPDRTRVRIKGKYYMTYTRILFSRSSDEPDQTIHIIDY